MVLRAQSEGYEWLKKLYDPLDTYIISEEKLRDERKVSEENLKYIGNMYPIQVIALDKNNIDRFLQEDMKKFDLIIEQGEHFPLSLLINKYAKKHGVITLDIHQSNDYYDKLMSVSILWKLLSYLNFIYRFVRYRYFRHLIRVLIKHDIRLAAFVIRRFNITGFRFYPSLPAEYRFNKCFVCGNKFKRIYKQMGYQDNEVVIRGDYDLTKYQRYNGEIYSSDKPYVIYIDSYNVMKYTFHSEFNKFAMSMTSAGYDFFFYPHPNLNEEFFTLLDKNIKVLPKRTIEKYLENADFVFVHNSNMVNILIYAEKRFCFIYGPKMIGGSYLKRQSELASELGIPNLDVREKDRILETVRHYRFHKDKYDEYLHEYCGDRELHKKGSDTILIDTIRDILVQKGIKKEEGIQVCE